MENAKQKEFVDYVCNTLDEFKKLFLAKNAQYSTDSDPLANFRAGALLRGADDSWAEMYEEAKNYRRKHVVHIERHGIDADKGMESLKDTAIYSVIMMFMCKCFTKGPESVFHCHKQQESREQKDEQ